MSDSGIETILVVEDERQIREAVVTALECEGFAVCEAATAGHAAVQAASRLPHLVILDLGLPDRDGVDFIRDYRTWSAVPILVLSARSEEESKVEALDAGADDYLTKPFGVAELLARVRALLRRRPTELQGAAPKIEFGDYAIDCVNRVVTRAGVPIHLTQIEYRLLVYMAANPGRVLTHRHLLAQVWGGQAVENHQYLRVYVGHLRQKIEDTPTQPRFILTEIGVGYRFES
ncbi:MAG: two-component system, OmpR family, KDP operon response regulator KdpE [Azoarcus sp.]|uniref:Two-component system, OmpR family, KDP operon response regulator KdpE n=1 Tax=Aromatoleum tolulyticum TaxID=34027 RepID=A0A1N6YP04_9RHOO|nr:response regulator [Aromatoleum tolulyticum]MCK9985138.1 two-component system, OmpR family, KDP operon response regulator KdpE [Azoarcus sp.]SIR16378.1 two-component system, OmpR family, KDP operon response regulator KdpE [Aromatoleum tolulyticum]